MIDGDQKIEILPLKREILYQGFYQGFVSGRADGKNAVFRTVTRRWSLTSRAYPVIARWIRCRFTLMKSSRNSLQTRR